MKLTKLNLTIAVWIIWKTILIWPCVSRQAEFDKFTTDTAKNTLNISDKQGAIDEYKAVLLAEDQGLIPKVTHRGDSESIEPGREQGVDFTSKSIDPSILVKIDVKQPLSDYLKEKRSNRKKRAVFKYKFTQTDAILLIDRTKITNDSDLKIILQRISDLGVNNERIIIVDTTKIKIKVNDDIY